MASEWACSPTKSPLISTDLQQNVFLRKNRQSTSWKESLRNCTRMGHFQDYSLSLHGPWARREHCLDYAQCFRNNVRIRSASVAFFFVCCLLDRFESSVSLSTNGVTVHNGRRRRLVTQVVQPLQQVVNAVSFFLASDRLLSSLSCPRATSTILTCESREVVSYGPSCRRRATTDHSIFYTGSIVSFRSGSRQIALLNTTTRR